MGAWGVGSFENDTALDFAADVAGGGGVAALEKAFDRVLASGENYLEASDAQEALMAAEVVARMKGRPGAPTTYLEEIDAWIVRSRPVASPSLIEKAHRSIDRSLAESSELVELWQETEDFEAWKLDARGILDRL